MSTKKENANANSKLFAYLKKINKEDLKQIQKYLQSPFFKVENRERVILLFDFIKKFHPDYDNVKLSNEALERKMKFTNFNNVKSTLVNCIEDYLKVNAFQQSQHLQISLFSKTLNDLNLNNEFNKYTKKELEKLEAKQVKSEDDYHLKYKLLREMFTQDKADIVSNKNAYLEDSIIALNNYYLHINLNNLLAYNYLKKILNKGTNVNLAKKIIYSIDYDNDIDDFNIIILYNIFIFNEIENLDKKKAVYSKLKEIVIEKSSIFSSTFQYEVYAGMLNMATSLRLAGIDSFTQELFNIHKFWVEKGVHLTHTTIHCHLFFNIATSACNVNEFNWYSKFVEKNSKYLLQSEKKQTLALAESYFKLKTKNYEDVLLNLAPVKFLNSQFNLFAKALGIQALYELNDPYRFEIYQRNFKNYILRQNEISERIKDANSHFIKIISKIEKARHEKNTSALNKIKEYTLKQKEILYRPWLLEKINELLN